MAAKKPEPVVEVKKAELLTTEFHPILGRIERWRMSDGSVRTFETQQSWQ